MAVLTWNPEQEDLSRAGRSVMHNVPVPPGRGLDLQTDEPEAPGVWETAVSTYQTEAWVGSLWAGYANPTIARGLGVDPDFNPYEFFLDHRKDFEDFEPMVRMGALDDIVNETQFRTRVEAWRRETENRENIAHGSGFGVLLGAGMSLLDIATLIPIGGRNVIRPGQRAASALRMGASAGMYGAVSEGLLHRLQEQRTLQESLLNIGTGSLLGGGLGAWAAGARPGSSLHPRNPNNPLHLDSPHAALFATRGDREGDLVVATAEGVATRPGQGNDSVGAAAARDAEDSKIRSAVMDHYDRAMTKSWRDWNAKEWGSVLSHWGLEKFDGITPAARILRSPFRSAREAGLRMFDTGGIYTKSMFKGQGGFAAEDWKNFYRTWYAETHGRMRERLSELNLEVGQRHSALRETGQRIGRFSQDYLGTPQLARGQHITEDDFSRWLGDAMFDERLLKGDWNPNRPPPIMEELGRRFNDDQVDVIKRHLNEQMEDIHRFNQRMEDEMVRLGMIADDQRLGRAYKMSIQFDTKGIASDLPNFKAFLRRMLSDTPPQSFFDEIGVDPQQWRHLGTDTSPRAGETPEKFRTRIQQERQERDQILEDWLGTKDMQRQAQLETGINRLTRELGTAKSELMSLQGEASQLSRQTTEAKAHRQQAEETIADLEGQIARLQQQFQGQVETAQRAQRYLSNAQRGQPAQFQGQTGPQKRETLTLGDPKRFGPERSAELPNIGDGRPLPTPLGGGSLLKAEALKAGHKLRNEILQPGGDSTLAEVTASVQAYIDDLAKTLGMGDIRLAVTNDPGKHGSFRPDTPKAGGTLALNQKRLDALADPNASEESVAQTLSTVYHEIGHALHFHRMRDVGVDTRRAIFEDYIDWLRQSSHVRRRMDEMGYSRQNIVNDLEGRYSLADNTRSQAQFSGDLYFPKTLHPGIPPEELGGLLRQRAPLTSRLEMESGWWLGEVSVGDAHVQYLLRFHEYFAEQVAKHFLANPPPAVSAMQKFFQRFADAITRFYRKVTGQEGITDVAPDSVARFIEEVMQVPPGTAMGRPGTQGANPSTPSLAAHAERQNHLAKSIQRRIRKLDKHRRAMQRQLDKTRRVEQQLSEARKQNQSIRQQIQQERKQLRKGLGKAEKAQRRAVKRNLNQYVEDLTHRITNRHMHSSGVTYEEDVFQLSMQMSRQLPWTDALRREAMGQRFLKSDIWGALGRQNELISGRLAMRQAFGSDDMGEIIGRGSQRTDPVSGGQEPLGGELFEEYQQMLEAAKARGASPKEISGITRAYESAREDLIGMRDRVTGVAYSVDPENILIWGGRKAKQAQYLSHGMLFGIASIPDVVSALFHLGKTSGRARRALGGTQQSLMRTVGNLNQALKTTDGQSIRRWLNYTEAFDPRTMALADASDTMGYQGVGPYGSARHTMTSATDRVMGGMSEMVGQMSGMRHMTRFLKGLTMINQQWTIKASAENYGDLLRRADAGDRDVQNTLAELASVGLGREQMERIGKMVGKYPVDDDDFSLGINRWLQEGVEGEQAYADVTMAMNRAANRSVPTPGIGDRPLLMDKPGWSVIFQFWSFGLTINNRVFRPLRQRIVELGEWENLSTVAGYASAGFTVMVLRDFLNGRNTAERPVEDIIYGSLDRGGMFAYASPFASSVYQGVFGGDSAKYHVYTNWWQQLAGPSAGMASELGVAAHVLSQGDLQQASEKLVRLAPFGSFNSALMTLSRELQQ